MRRILALLAHDSVLTALGLVLVATTFWLLTDHQQAVAQRAFATHDVADHMLVAILGQETSLRGLEESGHGAFLDRYEQGARDFQAARGDLRERLRGNAGLAGLLDSVVARAQAWQREADGAIRRLTRDGPAPASLQELRERARLMAGVRGAHDALAERLDEEGERTFARSRLLALAILVAISGLYATGAVLVARRRNAVERAVRDARREFGLALRSAESETEAHALLTRRIARAVPEASTVVALQWGAGDDRLEPLSPVEDPAFRGVLAAASPNDCLAVRTGWKHLQDPTREPLLACEVCRATGMHTICVPSLAGGEVTGTLLATAPRAFSGDALDEIEGSVEQVGPVIAGLRTLELAEHLARTDALTGLSNRRDAVATLHRMAAQAVRSALPLSAVMIDLDHFKRLNDRLGHEAGDDALVAVADAIRARLRESDYAARWGGEELLVLLPDTGRDDAASVAEEMRKRVAVARTADPSAGLTASFGVAELPADAIDAESLVREADRALYVAKQTGRNRVAVAAPSDAAVWWPEARS